MAKAKKRSRKSVWALLLLVILLASLFPLSGFFAGILAGGGRGSTGGAEAGRRAGSLEITVLSAMTQMPVEGALVLLADGDRPGRLWPPQTSGPEGRFRIRDLPPGPYRVTVRAGEGALEDLPLVVRPGEVRVIDLPELDVRDGPAASGE